MTIGGIVAFVVITVLIGLGVIALALSEVPVIAKIIAAVAGIAAVILIYFGFRWYYANTATGSRALKTQESNLSNGIERTVKVYDVQGDLIKEYSGKFDVDYDDDRIIFDDEEGKRHIIYYPTGTVIIDEI